MCCYTSYLKKLSDYVNRVTCNVQPPTPRNSYNFLRLWSVILYSVTHTKNNCQGQQEGTQMQNERNKYLLKHKTLQGGAQGWTVLKLLQTAGEN